MDKDQPFLETWGRWILGGLLTTIIALILVQWASMDRRMSALEDWRARHTEVEIQQTAQLALVTARQEQVLARLDRNADKLDELLRLYYQLQGSK